MKFYLITDNNFLYAGFASLLHGTIYTLHRASANEINNTLLPVNTFVIIDGISHAITTHGYCMLSHQNIPVFFYLNIKNCLLTHLSGINILDTSATKDCLQNRLLNIVYEHQLVCARRIYFTQTESLILRLALSGMTSLQISQLIAVTQKTIACHVRHILKKSGIKNSGHISLLKNILAYHLAHHE